MNRRTEVAGCMAGLAVLLCLGLGAGAQTISLKLKPPPEATKSGKHIPATAQSSKAAPVPPEAANKSVLPDVFDGWVEAAKPTTLTDATQADASNAAALKEYGFTGGTFATYKRGGETLSIHELRFGDLSGAYGAYTFYRQNNWPKEDIGTGATSDRKRVLFWKGSIVIDATFSTITTSSAAEMREIAKRIGSPRGNRGLAPTILASLPQDSLEKQTTHYALGPAGYAGAGGVLPAELIGFDKGAEETVTANYDLRSGPATLTLINYPTPQIAAAQETRIREYLKADGKGTPAWTKPLNDSDKASLEVRRSGPIVALVSGDAIPDESHKLLQLVHYDEEMTAIPQPTVSEVSKTSQLLMGIATICMIGAGAAILLGFFLGGGRALYRIARGKPASSVYEAEFIRLNLKD